MELKPIRTDAEYDAQAPEFESIKQGLLEARTPEERASVLIALLQMGVQAGPQSDPPPDSRPS